MPIARGMEAARGTGGNIFTAILQGVAKEKLRRVKQDRERDEKEFEFLNTLEKLEKQEELKRGTIRLEAKEERITKREFPTSGTVPRRDILRQKAQQEAYRRLGGSLLVGISPERQQRYVELQKKLFKKYSEEAGLGGIGKVGLGGIGVSPIDEQEEDLFDTNW